MLIDNNQIKPLFTYIDNILKSRKVTPEMIDHMRHQIMYDIIRGIDPISTYERRTCKISDEMWDFALHQFREELKIKEQK